MPDSSGIRAGAAYYELSLKDGKLTKGLRAWSGKLKAWGAGIKAVGRNIAGIGAAIKAPLVAAEGVFGELGTQMARMSQRTGASVESLSQLGYAAKQSGVDAESLEGGLRKMQKHLGEAEQGNGAAILSFQRLGLSINDLKSLSPDQQFEAIADKLGSIQDPALRTAATMEIFGKSGASLLPLLEQGRGGIEALRKEADDLGLTMSGSDANAAVTFTQAMDRVWEVVKMVAFNVGAALAPALTEVVGTITTYVSMVAKWIKTHKDVIVTIAKIATGVVAAGAAIYAMPIASDR